VAKHFGVLAVLTGKHHVCFAIPLCKFCCSVALLLRRSTSWAAAVRQALSNPKDVNLRRAICGLGGSGAYLRQSGGVPAVGGYAAGSGSVMDLDEGDASCSQLWSGAAVPSFTDPSLRDLLDTLGEVLS